MIMKRFAWVGLCLAVVFAGGSCSPGTMGKTDLALRLDGGTRLAVTLTMKSSTEFQGGGMSIIADGEGETSFDVVVEDVRADGSMAMKATVQTVDASGSVSVGFLGTMDLKDARGRSPFGQILKHARGQSFTFTLSSSGRVSDLKGAEAIQERMKDLTDFTNFPGSEYLSSDAIDGIVRSMMEGFSKGGLTSDMETLFAVLPDGPVVVGDTWKPPAVFDPELDATTDKTFTFVEEEGDSVRVHLAAMVTPSETNELGIDVGNSVGTVWVDKATGVATKQSVSDIFRASDKASGGSVTVTVKLDIEIVAL